MAGGDDGGVVAGFYAIEGGEGAEFGEACIRPEDALEEGEI